MANEPPSESDPGPMTDEEWEPFARATGIEPPTECPGGAAVEVDAVHNLARCRCGIWFTTLMDEPTFPPHTITPGGAVKF